MVCGAAECQPFALRNDGVQVVCCAKCGMGVINPIPDDLLSLYGDDYYGSNEGFEGEPDRGYLDYTYTAEHGVSWAAALVKLLRPAGGRVLDIGCADGHLLTKLGTGYAKFGIEATEIAGRVAGERGVEMLGRDLFDPILIERYHGSFDVITAIAVFEHLSDIRAGMDVALRLLQDDGVLLFEVPLMSSVHNNETWLTSSLEHVWYPTEPALQKMIQEQLGAQLVGAEIFIAGYASTYVGLVFREGANEPFIREVVARVLTQQSEPSSPDEAVARMLLHLVHAATATHSAVAALVNLPVTELNSSMMRRIVTLWQDDLWRLRLARLEVDKVQARVHQLQSDLDTARSDHIRNRFELTAGLATTQAQLAVAKADLAFRIAAEGDLSHQKAILNRDRTAVEAALAEVNAVRAGALWRVAIFLSQAGQRHPRLGRLAHRTARVLWWTMRGQLIDRLRLRRQIRAQLRAEASVSHASAADPSDVAGELVILEETGHRPPLTKGERPSDWPLVSVVIVSFNYGPFVIDAVDSVLAQTFKDLEVIVVDGGSSDLASRFAAAGVQHPRTRVLMQGVGRRAGANRNFGISQARGRYICCLDADDTLAPTYIEKAVYLLERHNYDVVSGALKMVGGDDCQINVVEEPNLEDLLAVNHVLTCAVFRRSLWEQAGGYRDVDHTVSGYVYEDWAFWIRLAAFGARFRNLPRDPVLLYRVHTGNASLSRGKDVLPMHLQRDRVHRMNQDVLQSAAEHVAMSRRQAALRYGAPPAPPALIVLDRAPPVLQPPTLLLAMPFLILGGAERLLSTIVGHLTKMGWRVVITTSIEPGSEHGDTTPWFKRYTSEIFNLPRCFPPELWEDFVHHLVRSREVDVVWVVGSAFMYDSLRGLRAEHPHLRVADLLFNTVGHTDNNRQRRDLIDLIFVENNEVQGWLLARGEDPTRIRMVESGVDLTALRPMPRSEDLVQRIGAEPEDLIVGFSGRWSEEKNPLGFIEIARLVDPSLPVRFVMTGTGGQRPAIEQAIRAADFPEGRFHLLGEVSDIAPVLASLDLLVIPSVLDGRPVVALEALAMGVPILASRVGALPDLVQDGVTGWVCEPNDFRVFAECINHAGLNRASLKDMRLRARVYADAKLDLDVMTNAYRTGLESLLPKERRSTGSDVNLRFD